MRLVTAVTICLFIETLDNALATSNGLVQSENGVSPQPSTENVSCGSNICSQAIAIDTSESTEDIANPEEMQTSPIPVGDNINSTETDSSNGNKSSNSDNDSPGNETEVEENTGPPYSVYRELTTKLWTYITPVVMAIGLLGNSLSVIILIRQARKCRVTSTIIYLLVLAVSDTVILLLGPLRNWIVHIWGLNLRHINIASCKMHIYFTYVSAMLSSWILVAVTMERAISVILPHKVRIGCTPRSATLVVGLITVTVFALNIPMAVMHGAHYDPRMQKPNCGPTTEHYETFRDDYWHWVDMMAVFFLPFLFLLIGNITIVRKLAQARARRRRMSHTDGTTADRDTRTASILFIILSVFFLLTIAPITVYQIYSPYRLQELYAMPKTEGYLGYQHLQYQRAIVHLVSYLNAALNFVFYVVSGSRFRDELKQMVKEMVAYCGMEKGRRKSSGGQNKTELTSI